MKVIIAGSRTLRPSIILLDQIIKDTIPVGLQISEVVCGEAQGIDTIGKKWAQNNNIAVKSFPANWNKHGKIAGPLRNNEMAQYADAAIVITTGSKGSENMISTMNRYKKPVFVHRIK